MPGSPDWCPRWARSATATTPSSNHSRAECKPSYSTGKDGKRIELANAIFEYLEIFHNRRRRHSALGMRSPIEYEMMQSSIQPVA
ncbi:IS3 family transposase [Nocardia sp. NPDC005366]|uniref:IS3 family transposase n=1 Tax=Nocardia sp. NPDC005366 TaxID=3156878 RepID=UPI0033A10111